MEETKSSDGNRGFAAVTYFLFFLPLITKTKDQNVRFHFKQAVGLAIVSLAIQGVIAILGWWQFFGGLLFLGLLRFPLMWALRIFFVWMAIIGAKNALGGKMQELPWIGKYASRLF